MTTHMEFNTAGNYYGKLMIRVFQGTPQWCVENYSGEDWRPIPEYLYDALVRFWTDEEQVR